MKIIETEIPGVVLIETRVFHDDRGYFREAWHLDRFAEIGLPVRFVQDNVSYSNRGVLRGLHYQHPAAQGKLVSVLRGAIYDVAVDIRVGSPTFGRWVGAHLAAGEGRMIYIPQGFAHGFVVTGDDASVLYKCTDFYTPSDECAVLWSDPDLGIGWPVADPQLSPKDRIAPRLADVRPDLLPRFPTA